MVQDVVELKKRLHIATLGLYNNMLVEHVITKRGADKIAIIYTERNEEELRGIKERHETKNVLRELSVIFFYVVKRTSVI